MAVSNLELDSAINTSVPTAGLCDISPDQNTAIKSFTEGRDVFIICFSVLPCAFDYLYKHVGSIVVVVSPLIALMKDQVSI